MATVSMTTVTVVDATQPLALHELAHACGADTAWVVQLVEVGIVEAGPPDAPPERWQFESRALRSALEARRLERDFGVGLEAAALIIDLEHEVRRLKARLAVRGL